MSRKFNLRGKCSLFSEWDILKSISDEFCWSRVKIKREEGGLPFGGLLVPSKLNISSQFSLSPRTGIYAIVYGLFCAFG